MQHPELAARFRVAFELRRTVEELGSMTLDEFAHWCAFLKARDEAAAHGGT
jgi:hypothetical protein